MLLLRFIKTKLCAAAQTALELSAGMLMGLVSQSLDFNVLSTVQSLSPQDNVDAVSQDGKNRPKTETSYSTDLVQSVFLWLVLWSPCWLLEQPFVGVNYVVVVVDPCLELVSNNSV